MIEPCKISALDQLAPHLNVLLTCLIQINHCRFFGSCQNYANLKLHCEGVLHVENAKELLSPPGLQQDPVAFSTGTIKLHMVHCQGL